MSAVGFLRFDRSTSKVLISAWVTMIVVYYAEFGAEGRKLAVSSVKYLCGGAVWIDEAYALPMLSAFAISIFAIVIFTKYGDFEQGYPKTNRNGSSVAAAGYLLAALTVFLCFMFIPCDQGLQGGSGMGLAKYGGVLLSFGRKSFIIFSLLHSAMMSYFFYTATIAIKTHRESEK